MRLLAFILFSLSVAAWSAPKEPRITPTISDDTLPIADNSPYIPVLQPYIRDENIAAQNSGSPRIDDCTFKLRHLSYEGLRLIGEDANEVYRAIQNLKAPPPKTIRIGTRNSPRNPHYIDFSRSNREDINKFLAQLREMDPRFRPRSNNFVFEVYKAAGLMFDGPEAGPLGRSLTQTWDPQAQLYVNGYISMRIGRDAGGHPLYDIDFSQAGPDEVENIIEVISQRLGPTGDIFDRTMNYGIPLLERSEPRVSRDLGM